ncbi:hypothetical protein SLS55_008463 [Diplodia seriata]|uniref:Uncharacterized protein n=1 Tax=Diplodia seriata TaxID=420778 RepID=A0ABR3C613_9PEZI
MPADWSGHIVLVRCAFDELPSYDVSTIDFALTPTTKASTPTTSSTSGPRPLDRPTLMVPVFLPLAGRRIDMETIAMPAGMASRSTTTMRVLFASGVPIFASSTSRFDLVASTTSDHRGI